ncbi:hypothetical protein AAFF_G00004070 [Aldrovandia affinis]|uniref:Uncharacterized protein n=1 Tax=Aldrovandia affinis TaxID=143900 RepID=A0AAD7TF65_9TELE|nr:hypothetical protein AAFF_G00004070 [Aldrovandia affinis]
MARLDIHWPAAVLGRNGNEDDDFHRHLALLPTLTGASGRHRDSRQEPPLAASGSGADVPLNEHARGVKGQGAVGMGVCDHAKARGARPVFYAALF